MVKVFDASDTKKEIRTIPSDREGTKFCDGEGTVPKGTNLWFGGKDGKVKEI